MAALETAPAAQDHFLSRRRRIDDRSARRAGVLRAELERLPRK
jgi:hypothetical protein